MGHKSYAQLPKSFDAYKHLIADFSDNPEIFSGIGEGGMRTDFQYANKYDRYHAEMVEEHLMRKDRRARKVDKRTRAERLADYEQKKQGKKDYADERNYGMYLSDWKAMYDGISHAERMIRHAEKVARADWKLESAEIEYELEYWEFVQNCEEEAEQMRKFAQKTEELRKLEEWLRWA